MILLAIMQAAIAMAFLCTRTDRLDGGAAVSAFAEGELTIEVAVGTLQPPPAATETDRESAETPTPTLPLPTVDTVFRVEVLRDTPTPVQKKRILIYHTHTWEAYRQVPEAPYEETEKWRTKDSTCNVVAVGKVLAANLTAMGFEVVHDETAFEPPDLSDAYSRSLSMLEKRVAAGETYDLYIDLHRDAVASNASIRRTVSIGGADTARFMVLIGKGTTGGYDEKPDWEANYTIAERITSSLNGQCEGLARDVKVKTGRFNQHIAPCCVLIECGVNSNTLEEVLLGIPYLAQAISDALAIE